MTLSVKSKGKTNTLITKEDLKVSTFKANQNANVFPPINFVKVGNIVQLIINGPQTSASNSGVWKEYPIPSEVVPHTAFAAVFKATTGKEYGVEVNETSCKLRSFVAGSGGDWIGFATSYISKNLGGGGHKFIQKFRTSCFTKFDCGVTGHQKQGGLVYVA